MARRLLGHVGMFALICVTLDAGGWAVVTLEDLPDYVAAREPVALTFAVRVHGVTLTSGLHASVTAAAGPLAIKAKVSPAVERGYYRAALTLPHAGTWTLSIDSGHGTNNVTRLTVQAIEPGTPAPVVRDLERGQRLFAAKGCATCHVHEAVPSNKPVSVGPQLTGRRFEPQSLRSLLARPPAPKQYDGYTVGMPNLGLSEREISALVAFLNDGTAPSARLSSR